MTKMSGLWYGLQHLRLANYPDILRSCVNLARLLQLLIVIGLVGSLLEGCVWSPDIQEREVSQLPPVIDYSLMTPDPDSVVIMTGPTVFSVSGAVKDMDDPLSILYYWWFLDYQENHGPALFTGRAFDQIQIDPCMYPELKDSTRIHTLEVVVADPTGGVQYDPARGRKISHAAVGVWLIKSQVSCQ